MLTAVRRWRFSAFCYRLSICGWFLVLAVGSSPAARAGAILTLVEAEQNGVGGVQGLDGPWDVVVTPDGASVYAAGRWSNAVAVFSRDPGTGALTFVEAQQDGVGGVDGLDVCESVAVSPDGKHVYAVSSGDDAVAVFERDPSTGRLTFVEVQKDGVGGVKRLADPYLVRVSPDGAHVYVSGNTGNAVVVFERDPSTGRLAFVEAQSRGVKHPEWVTVSPDGADVYATNTSNCCAHRRGVAVFRRNSGTGELSFVGEKKRRQGLGVASSVAVSADGQDVYATGWRDSTLVVFRRNPLTGSLRFMDMFENGVGGVYGMKKPDSVTVSPDGRLVYATAQHGGLAVFARVEVTGALTFIEAVSGPAMLAPEKAAVSSDGESVYVVAFMDDALNAFARTGCGNGTLDAGDECDDGAGNGPDQCCSLTCTVVDSDGDGTCDRDDSCPHLPLATATPMSNVRRVRLSYRSTGPGGRDDRQVVSGAEFTSSMSFDPVSNHTVHVRLTNVGPSGGTVFASSLAPGSLWSQADPARKYWRYRDSSNPPAAGVSRAVLREAPAGSGTYRLRVKGKDRGIESVPVDPGTDHLRATLEIESGGVGECFAYTLSDCEGTERRYGCNP